MAGLMDRILQNQEKASGGKAEAIKRFLQEHRDFRGGVYLFDFNVRTGEVQQPTFFQEVGVRAVSGQEHLGTLSEAFNFRVNDDIVNQIPEGKVIQMVVLDQEGQKVAEQPFHYRVYRPDSNHTFLEQTTDPVDTPVPLRVVEKRVVDTGSPGKEVAYNFLPKVIRKLVA